MTGAQRELRRSDINVTSAAGLTDDRLRERVTA